VVTDGKLVVEEDVGGWSQAWARAVDSADRGEGGGRVAPGVAANMRTIGERQRGSPWGGAGDEAAEAWGMTALKVGEEWPSKGRRR
jgi:hypothetical protein